jgi:nucleotide-binding universal stress UspA family protein
MNAWKQIGCAVDFSAHSWAALERAVDLARRLEARLTIVHVFPPGQLGAGALVQAERALGMAEERLLGRLGEWRAAAERALGREVQAQLLAGSPARELAKFAGRGLDLLVVGTRGPTGLGRLLLGSVAERVVRDAPCPVMVVHEREGELPEADAAPTPAG